MSMRCSSARDMRRWNQARKARLDMRALSSPSLIPREAQLSTSTGHAGDSCRMKKAGSTRQLSRLYDRDTAALLNLHKPGGIGLLLWQPHPYNCDCWSASAAHYALCAGFLLCHEQCWRLSELHCSSQRCHQSPLTLLALLQPTQVHLQHRCQGPCSSAAGALGT